MNASTTNCPAAEPGAERLTVDSDNGTRIRLLPTGHAVIGRAGAGLLGTQQAMLDESVKLRAAQENPEARFNLRSKPALNSIGQ